MFIYIHAFLCSHLLLAGHLLGGVGLHGQCGGLDPAAVRRGQGLLQVELLRLGFPHFALHHLGDAPDVALLLSLHPLTRKENTAVQGKEAGGLGESS